MKRTLGIILPAGENPFTTMPLLGKPCRAHVEQAMTDAELAAAAACPADMAALRALLGEEPHTPLDDAVAATLGGLGCLPAPCPRATNPWPSRVHEVPPRFQRSRGPKDPRTQGPESHTATAIRPYEPYGHDQTRKRQRTAGHSSLVANAN